MTIRSECVKKIFTYFDIVKEEERVTEVAWSVR